MSELLIETILGDKNDPALARKLHDLGHHGGHVETLVVTQEDLPAGASTRTRITARPASSRCPAMSA
ncbi:hypothetical protein GT370_02830 [Acidocella sp. MX-AZ03]|uniref:hypothetical protein n=1 Tax=Acidocella sp. MX-AZ03 TaxID=2697363 RepID=UPI0022DE2DF8|nr:hypothetical protein [Acidocella sp. MX-AZ03]WBO59842.1 hypothetical protein GT370_02830 [Acidocella sp. MX-AZ03]